MSPFFSARNPEIGSVSGDSIRQFQPKGTEAGFGIAAGCS